jgi:hypothetical protein
LNFRVGFLLSGVDKNSGEVTDHFPFEMDITTMAAYEASGKPIILKNGAKMYPEGWLRLLRMTAEDVLK